MTNSDVKLPCAYFDLYKNFMNSQNNYFIEIGLTSVVRHWLEPVLEVDQLQWIFK